MNLINFSFTSSFVITANQMDKLQPVIVKIFILTNRMYDKIMLINGRLSVLSV